MNWKRFCNKKYEGFLIFLFGPEIAGHDAKTVPVSQGPNCSYCVIL